MRPFISSGGGLKGLCSTANGTQTLFIRLRVLIFARFLSATERRGRERWCGIQRVIVYENEHWGGWKPKPET